MTCKNVYDDPYNTDLYLDPSCEANDTTTFNDFFKSDLPVPKEAPYTFSPTDAQKQYTGFDKYDPVSLIACKKLDPEDMDAGDWFMLYWQCNCQGEKSCEVPVHHYATPKANF